jgi:hypothetical protein
MILEQITVRSEIKDHAFFYLFKNHDLGTWIMIFLIFRGMNYEQ